MWSVWLVFCDCGFHSVCPLMEKDKSLMEASWWEILTYCPWIIFILSIFLVVQMGMEKDHHSKPGGDRSLRTWQRSHCPFFCPVESDHPTTPPWAGYLKSQWSQLFFFYSTEICLLALLALVFRESPPFIKETIKKHTRCYDQNWGICIPDTHGDWKYLSWLSEIYLLGIFLTRARKIN